MKKYSDEVHNFLINVILPQMKVNDYTEDNIDEILDFISNNYEDPLCIAQENGKELSDIEKEKLSIATKAITEITTRSDWK